MDEGYRIGRKFENDRPDIVLYQTKFPRQEALFAMVLLERWGMVQGKDGGEDSAGRARVELMPVSEVIDRACTTAEMAFAEFEKRDWIMNVPSPDEASEMLKADDK